MLTVILQNDKHAICLICYNKYPWACFSFCHIRANITFQVCFFLSVHRFFLSTPTSVSCFGPLKNLCRRSRWEIKPKTGRVSGRQTLTDVKEVCLALSSDCFLFTDGLEMMGYDWGCLSYVRAPPPPSVPPVWTRVVLDWGCHLLLSPRWGKAATEGLVCSEQKEMRIHTDPPPHNHND